MSRDLLGGYGSVWGRPIFTKREWLPVSAAIAHDANVRVGSRGGLGASTISDLAIQVGPKATGKVPAPAFYDERAREIVIDSEVALPGVDPLSVRWDSRDWRRRHLRAAGLVEHEVGHAVHTPKGLLSKVARSESAEVVDFARCLEETRMEAATVRGGGDSEALAAVANELILRDWTPQNDRMADAMNAALILGRSDLHGGAMPDADLADYRDAYSEILGAETVASVEDFIGDWNRVRDEHVPDGRGFRELRERFCGMVGVDPEASESGGDGAGGGGEGEGSSDAAGGRAKVRGMLVDRAEDSAAAAAAAAAEADAAEAESDAEASKSISHGYTGGSAPGGTYGVPIDPAARKLAVDLTAEFKRIAMPDVRKVKRARALPPGRLRGRGVVLQSAQAAAGVMPTAEPFRHVRKSITRTPPPVVGIMVDTSGSMRSAEVPAATLGWALAEAGRAVQARTSLVTFGNVGRVVKHVPTEITATRCSGGWENFRDGFKHLDGRLHLTSAAPGARVLFIVTDGGFVDGDQPEISTKVTRHLERIGATVVWVDFGHWVGHVYGVGAVGRRVTVDPSDAAAAARLLAAAVTGAMAGGVS